MKVVVFFVFDEPDELQITVNCVFFPIAFVRCFGDCEEGRKTNYVWGSYRNMHKKNNDNDNDSLQIKL